MYNHQLHQQINGILQKNNIDIAGKDNLFYIRMMTSADAIHRLYNEIYGGHPMANDLFEQLLAGIIQAYVGRSEAL
ncbi:MAG: hypothetical protein ACXVA2_20295, partial [Mucilaginibacter sp.]